MSEPGPLSADMELLFQAARVSPVLRDAVERVRAALLAEQQKNERASLLAEEWAAHEHEPCCGECVITRAEAAKAILAALAESPRATGQEPS